VRVALTFDAEHPDGPGSRPGLLQEILELLEARARATSSSKAGGRRPTRLRP
jgi:hypothetical protein